MGTRKLKFKIQMRHCTRCGGSHADWWRSVPPPSCDERVLGKGRP